MAFVQCCAPVGVVRFCEDGFTSTCTNFCGGFGTQAPARFQVRGLVAQVGSEILLLSALLLKRILKFESLYPSRPKHFSTVHGREQRGQSVNNGVVCDEREKRGGNGAEMSASREGSVRASKDFHCVCTRLLHFLKTCQS